MRAGDLILIALAVVVWSSSAADLELSSSHYPASYALDFELKKSLIFEIRLFEVLNRLSAPLKDLRVPWKSTSIFVRFKFFRHSLLPFKTLSCPLLGLF